MSDLGRWSGEDAAKFAEEHYGTEVAEQFKGMYNAC